METLLPRLLIAAIITLVVFPALVAGAEWLVRDQNAKRLKNTGVRRKTLSQHIKEVNQFTFKEDTRSWVKPEAPKALRLIASMRGIYILLPLAGVVFYVVTGNFLGFLAFPISLAIAWVKAKPILEQRATTIARYFMLASGAIKFQTTRGRKSVPPAPWEHVLVESWSPKDNITPAKLVIKYPTGSGPNLLAQQAFEKSFVTAATDENIWDFEWDLPGDKLTITSIPHLPTAINYPGSFKHDWHEFLVGEGTKGAVSYSVKTFPHALIGGPSGSGKSLPLTTPIPTMNRGIIPLKELVVGDVVFNRKGMPTVVTHLHPIITPARAYAVELASGQIIVADADHLWSTYGATSHMLLPAFTDTQKATLLSWFQDTTNTETVALDAVAATLGIDVNDPRIQRAVHQVGPAEEVNPKTVYHHNAQIVTTHSIVTRVNLVEVVKLYNSRAEVALTPETPLTRTMFEKLSQLAFELRDGDQLTVESICEYVGANSKLAVHFFETNVDETLPPVERVNDLRVKAAAKHQPLPQHILIPEHEQRGIMASERDLANILGVDIDDVRDVWTFIVNESIHKVADTETVEDILSSRTEERYSDSYFTYPKRLILKRLLDLGDTRSSVDTTEELRDLLTVGRRFIQAADEEFLAAHGLTATDHEIMNITPVVSEPMRCVSVDSEDRLFLVTENFIPTHNSVMQRNLVIHCIEHNYRWRFLGIDTKQVELSQYSKYKKTITAVGVTVEEGLEILKFGFNLMTDRYKMLRESGQSNIMDMDDPPLHYLIMIDEAYDFLGLTKSKSDEGKALDDMKTEASDLVGRILRLGRAAGIHMVVAMQRPDAEVLRGEYKNNMDVRLAAGRMDSTPSSMLMDSGAANELPGNIKGRGALRVGGETTVFQGYYASEDFLDDFLIENPQVEPSTVAPGGYLHAKYLEHCRANNIEPQDFNTPDSSMDETADDFFANVESSGNDDTPSHPPVPPNFNQEPVAPAQPPKPVEPELAALTADDFVLDSNDLGLSTPPAAPQAPVTPQRPPVTPPVTPAAPAPLQKPGAAPTKPAAPPAAPGWKPVSLFDDEDTRMPAKPALPTKPAAAPPFPSP